MRDNKPTIPYPDYWSLIGGCIDKDESIEDGLIREVKEEIGYELKVFKFFKTVFDKSNNKPKQVYVYVGPVDKDLFDFKLTEGQKINFFSYEEIENLRIVPFLKDVLCEYYTSIGRFGGFNKTNEHKSNKTKGV